MDGSTGRALRVAVLQRVLALAVICVACLAIQAATARETRQATGVKVGEVTDTSAIVWMRLTADASRNDGGVAFERSKGRKGRLLPEDVRVADLEGACPGAPGRVRLRYGTREDLGDAKSTPWVEVAAASDFTHQFRLTDLKPATVYHYAAETGGLDGAPVHGAVRGRFETAPPPDAPADVTFTVITGMMYQDLDDRENGFLIYDAMARLRPEFLVPTGDTVYYDNDELRANTVALARHHWHRMYSLPRLVRFHLAAAAYWEKDDHDTLDNDCWPGRNPDSMAPLTFEEGQRVFLEQVPMGERTYRTVRWGRRLQVWLAEVRDFRSPNRAPDGPDKTIWGAAQKRWLLRTIRASDADWKVLVHPTPIVGPDRPKKADNHANDAFAHEGRAFREWVRRNVADDFFVACGDRHWQYHSVHPDTGVHEFSCGPASDIHAGGTPGRDPDYHLFHRVDGGFLSVSVGDSQGRSAITFRLHDVEGEVVYEYRRRKPVR